MVNPKQRGFFDNNHLIQTNISIKPGHDLVRIADTMPWPDMIEIAINCRASKVKALVGPDPHYRELLGAVVLMAVRQITYRQAEDLIAHYAPARYLCGLMDSTWQPDHITIFEFTQMLGMAGMESLNKIALLQAKELGILDPTVLMSDTTAQEAMIPYPNEVGLMKRFTELVTSNLKKVSGKFGKIKSKVKEIATKVKALVRCSHLFAKTKEEKQKVGKKLYHTTKELHDLVKGCLSQGYDMRNKAGQELERISNLMEKLFPQMLYFLETGFVASKKIIHLQMSELYSIVRGKAGKSVEFGLKWGINHINGFIFGFLINGGFNASDKSFCIKAIKEHKELFEKAPRIYGFDRGGYSKANIKKAERLGVKHVGIAPTGKADWAVSEKMSERIRRERAQVEGLIGNAKSKKYGFNKPNVKSISAMETSAQRSFLGMNLSKTISLLNLQQLQNA
jgi:hypothetical protein